MKKSELRLWLVEQDLKNIVATCKGCDLLFIYPKTESLFRLDSKKVKKALAEIKDRYNQRLLSRWLGIYSLTE